MVKNSKAPLRVYSIVPEESGRELWIEIGFATPHCDERGFDLNLRALPLNSKLVMREPFQAETKYVCTSSLSSQVKEFERAAIKRCLLETGGNIGAAMERLKIPRRTLSEKMARLGIDGRRFRPPRRQSRK
jgi:DNA-binding NtrC family response regulator